MQNSQAFFDDLSLFKNVYLNMFFGIVLMFVLIYSGLSQPLSLNFGILKGRLVPMEIEYFFYKIFDAIDKNFFEKAHASVAKGVI